MSKSQKSDESVKRKKVDLSRIVGATPWLKVIEKQDYKAKVFRSGNSLAVRIPAGTKLVAGMEMDLRIEDGEFLSYEPVNRPKRKFNIDKVWGCAKDSGLQFIQDDDGDFDVRPLLWDDHEWRAKHMPDE